MREFKFRAWDDVAKKMFYSTTEQFDDSLLFRFEHFETDEPVYMQYTGLKDCHGKGIYEGDIVKTDLGNGVVVFDSGEFLVRNLDDDEYYGFDDFFSLYKGGCYLVEVIGNIYENPEFLKEVS